MRTLFSILIVAALACGLFSRLMAAATPTTGADGTGDIGKPNGSAVEMADASNAFAFDLYAKLAADKQYVGKNLFFSPYSITTALDMVAEGARGETAQQMGAALRYPAAWRRANADPQSLPWDSAPIHAGAESLARRFTAKPVPPELSAEIDAARIELTREVAIADKMTEGSNLDWPVYQKQVEKAKQLGAKFDVLVAKLSGYELTTANALWGEKTYPFEKAYIDSIAKHYAAAGLVPADFLHNADGVRQDINTWIAKQTKDKIKDMLAPGSLTDITRLVLVNAIYFNGTWAEPFEPQETMPADFSTANGNLRVPMMNSGGPKNASYAAFNGDGSQFTSPELVSKETKKESCYPNERGFLVAELPYKGDGIVMTLLAPQAVDGLPALEQMLTAENIRAWTNKLVSRKTYVSIPKFSFKTTYKLNDPLAAMGMPRAFSPMAAQFDGISATKELFIELVQHDAFVDVNEKGTEAAAATFVGMVSGSVGPATWPFVPTFRADRPFLFMIRDKVSGVILFVGRIMKPEAKNANE